MPLTLLDRRLAFRKALDAERAAGRTVGLVPTMGALHRGHISLMARAAAECDVVAATLFVNPLQFGPGEDLATYPRDPAGDRVQTEAAGVTYLFAPTTEEMFPEPPVTSVTVGPIGSVLEGAFRPGHFAGVATIVTKLLSLAGPVRAYFGEKDYQQLAVIRRVVTDLSLPIDVVAGPTVRDADGLALSSRNAYLTPAERAVAPSLYRALRAGREMAEAAAEARRPVAGDDLRAAMRRVITEHPEIGLDYAEVAHSGDLSPVATLEPGGEARLLIAGRIGRTRLIDNLGIGDSP